MLIFIDESGDFGLKIEKEKLRTYSFLGEARR
ncbi:MAG: hypothetical protein ACD_7C00024G0003 [uncultured bacterium]|nr:MAG: hypothetical protein ACD_7C00024G0003 [uncultured bacterium]